MKRLLTLSLLFCFLFMAASMAYTQDSLKAKKMEGHTWHQVVMVKFKPGTIDQAMKIIDDHFAKAGMEAGLKGPQMMQFKTGEWDMMFVWSMKDIGDMNWEISPDDEKWWNAMVKQAGNSDKANQIMKDYMDLVDNTTTYLATSRQQMPEEGMEEQQEE